MYTWVAVNSASARKAASSHQRCGATAREAASTVTFRDMRAEMPRRNGKGARFADKYTIAGLKLELILEIHNES
jgi:hypothetical protein